MITPAALQSLYTYNIAYDEHIRSTNYTQPVTIKQLHYTPSGYVGLRCVDMTYDNFGMALTSVEGMWSDGQQVYVAQRSTANTYTATSWLGELLASETFTDETSGFQRCVKYELTSDQKQVASTQVSFKSSTDTAFSLWKTKTLTYDTQGRVLTETVTWSDGVPVPQGSVTSYTNQNSYDYDPQAFDIVTRTNPQGQSTKCQYAVRVNNGPVVSKTLPLGESESFAYDKLGRCISYTDPFGKTTTTAFVIGSSGNTITTTNSLGYIVQKTYDLHGQVLQVMDNGDPTQASGGSLNRVLSTSTFDSLSRVISTTDALGLKTTYGPYDGFNRLLSVIDPAGNVQSHLYDDVALASQRFLNNDLRQTTQLDYFSRITSSTSYPDSGDSTTTYVLVSETVFDGFDNATQRTISQQPRSGGSPTLLKQTTTSFNVENAPSFTEASTLTDLADNAFDTVRLTPTYDIFGNVYSLTKTVTYNDGKTFTHQSATSIFNSCNLLTTSQNQLGQEETYAYDASGNSSSITRYDGLVVSYKTDALGRMVTMMSNDPSQTLKFTYLDNGVTSTRQSAAGTIQYNYSLDGSATGLTYPDGSKQIYVLDQYGRTVKSIDTRGMAQTNSFDDMARISSRSLSSDTVTYSYGEVNHMNGQPIGYSLTGTRALDTALAYDGFGRPNCVTVKDPMGNVVLQTIRLFNSKGKLQQIEISSTTAPQLNYQRSYLYDGLGQLRQETTTTSGGSNPQVFEYTYDGNSNIIGITAADGTKTTRTYNAIDQRTDSGFQYDTNGRQTVDDQGRTYVYDQNDRLLQAQYQGSTVSFAYHPDDSLAEHVSATNTTTKLYYDCGSINTTTSATGGTTTGTSYFLGSAGSRMASTTDDPAAQPSVFLESDGIASLSFAGDSGPPTVQSYNAYGEPLPSTTGNSNSPVASSTGALTFGYRQEPTDPLTGLVYLRARFYQPNQASFITPDNPAVAARPNRLAFCAGDPVNKTDPSGHDAVTTALLAGLAVGLAASGVFAWAGAEVGAALFTANTVRASLFAATVAGAGGSVAGDATQAAVLGQQFTARRGVEDALSGALGAVAGGYAGTAAADGAMSAMLARRWSQRAISRIGAAVCGLIGGAAGSGTAAVAMGAIEGESPFSAGTAVNTAVGGLLGFLGSMGDSFAYRGLVDSNFMPVKLKEADFNDIHFGEVRDMVRVGRNTAPFAASLPWEDLQALRDNSEVLEFLNPATYPRGWAGRTVPGRARGNKPMPTFAVHGEPGLVTPLVSKGNGDYLMPMTPKLFAKFLMDSNFNGRVVPQAIKLYSSYGAKMTGQAIAAHWNCQVWASHGPCSVHELEQLDNNGNVVTTDWELQG